MIYYWKAALAIKICGKRIHRVYAPKLLITPGENVFIDSLLDDRDSIQSANLQTPGRQYTFRWNHPSGLTYAVKLSDVHVLPEYEDVSHESDNEMILRAEPGTYLHKLQTSLVEVIQSFCRHPIPSWYHISMKMFRERNTVGRKKACDGQEQKIGRCSQGSGGKEYFYQRSLNEQCGRNRAAPLPEETNAFYCTRDTPLITELFGETVEESEVELEETPCVENRRKCMACIKQAERELRKTDAHMKCVYADMRNKQVTEDHGSNRDSAVHPDAESRCCSLACYNTPACLIFHSPVCHSDQTKFTNQSRADICLKGELSTFG
ncbi:hypothetical protein FGIG_01667 [Fasciola gigantica]|uniref:Uncharacterized protein n=1 Tax=Fasciola gigantica TaxID=46835 RepID=A0A504YL86_FASGI|nr:hypothetical protein FGIG_01667 [Fasciola gigantica]